MKKERTHSNHEGEEKQTGRKEKKQECAHEMTQTEAQRKVREVGGPNQRGDAIETMSLSLTHTHTALMESLSDNSIYVR